MFAATAVLAGTSVIKLASALILTRLLYPEAYGVIAVVASIGTIVELISDIGVVPFFIRDKNAEQPRYVNTLWTLRLIRGCVNCAILFVCAPWIAELYGTPTLVDPIRVFSFFFVLHGLESMSFALALRQQRARIVNYSELICGLMSTCFVVGFSYFSRDHWGMVLGMLVNRLLLTAMSYGFYRELTPKFQMDREAAMGLLGFTKYVTPSSMVTVAAGQFDRAVFLRLFDLHLMGLYGVAGSITSTVDSLTHTVTRRILYARCTHAFRTDPSGVRAAYYRQNLELFALILFLPAAVGGTANFIITFLFDQRYVLAGPMLQALMIQSLLLAFSESSEVLVVAAGHIRATLVANLLRLAWMIPASLAGYHFAGFEGFLYGYVLNPLPALLYNYWQQGKVGLFDFRYELSKVAYALVVFAIFLLIGNVLLDLGLSVRSLFGQN